MLTPHDFCAHVCRRRPAPMPSFDRLVCALTRTSLDIPGLPSRSPPPFLIGLLHLSTLLADSSAPLSALLSPPPKDHLSELLDRDVLALQQLHQYHHCSQEPFDQLDV